MKKILIIILLNIGIINGLMAQDFKIYPLKSSIAEETFQALIIKEALNELGYKVEKLEETSPIIYYQTIAQNSDSNDVYFMATYWNPLQNNMFEKVGGRDKIYYENAYIENCAQGYLIDKKLPKNIILNISMT